MKKNIKNIVWLLLLFSILIGAELLMPKKINWRKSFVHNDRIPYGCFVLYHLLGDFFKEADLKINRVSFHELWNAQPPELFNPDKIFLLVNENFSINPTDLDPIFEMVRQGAVVLISAHHYDDEFCNLLNVKLQPYYFIIEEEALIDSTQLVHPKLPQKFFRYKRGILSYTHFSELPDSVDVLGKTSRGEANFVRISYGKGYFFLHTAPLVFTNYGMLSEDNKDYVAAILSCLPMREEVIWDEYYKIGREQINTPLRFILSQESLRWAYYVSIAGLLLFVLFKTKRTQRIIPEIPPLKNTTLEFAETIGLLYYHHGDHKNLAQKMILFWKDYLRNHYYLRSDTLDEQFAEELSQKTTISLEKIHNTLALIHFVESQPQITDETLIELYQKLDECKKAKHS